MLVLPVTGIPNGLGLLSPAHALQRGRSTAGEDMLSRPVLKRIRFLDRLTAWTTAPSAADIPGARRRGVS